MRSQVSTSTIDDAEVILGSIRRSVLIALQHPGNIDPGLSIRDDVEALRSHFAATEHPAIGASLEKITSFTAETRSLSEGGMLAILDEISKIESELIGNGLVDGEVSDKLLAAIDDSFREFDRSASKAGQVDIQKLDAQAVTAEDIDLELLEVFAEEANQLISEFETNLDRLTTPGDEEKAIWEIRRIAHTFKGSAGAVGLSDATQLAHRIEDVIALVESSKVCPTTQFRPVFHKTIGLLRDITNGNEQVGRDRLEAMYQELEAFSKDPGTKRQDEIAAADTEMPPVTGIERSEESTPQTKKPVVRVSLAVLDSIEERMRQLVDGLSMMQTGINSTSHEGANRVFARQFDEQRILATSINDALRAIRLVEFGTLTTRLQRAVRVACEEENKTAEILIENGELKIDTVLLDSLVEPLMHLLRNSVVHGLERAETRRLIGKAESGLVRIKLAENAEGVEITIADDGRGIDVNALKVRAVESNLITEHDAAALNDTNALELIFHTGLSTANKLSLLAGRGVGMSIVREAITSLDGTIEVESKTNHGTTFKIFVPTRSAEKNSSEQVRRSRNLTVLTVDDSASVRKLNKVVIEKCGCTPLEAKDVREAMKLLADDGSKPDLILTDLEMPVIDGFEFITWLKNQPGLWAIPVVVVSTKREPEIVTEALRSGAEGCIEKPLDKLKLESVLEEFATSH